MKKKKIEEKRAIKDFLKANGGANKIINPLLPHQCHLERDPWPSSLPPPCYSLLVRSS